MSLGSVQPKSVGKVLASKVVLSFFFFFSRNILLHPINYLHLFREVKRRANSDRSVALHAGGSALWYHGIGSTQKPFFIVYAIY